MVTKKKKSKKSGRGAALKIPMKASEKLQLIVKEKKVNRGDMMRLVWRYIKRHKLQSKKDARIIKPDEKLGKIIGKEPISMFKMTAKLSKHLS